MKTTNIIFILFILCISSIYAQQPPFYNEIQQFKKLDSLHKPQQHAILFTGSSSIRVWGNIQKYFPEYPLINRGFGGSTIPDVIRYADIIIFPYNPKQILIYCGENDMVDTAQVTPQVVTNRVKQLITLIRSRLEDVNILYVSIKPSPSRAYLMPRFAQANTMIEAYLKTISNTRFINVYSSMLNANGTPREELFMEDRLHMKPNGYALWQQIIKPYLVK